MPKAAQQVFSLIKTLRWRKFHCYYSRSNCEDFKREKGSKLKPRTRFCDTILQAAREFKGRSYNLSPNGTLVGRKKETTNDLGAIHRARKNLIPNLITYSRMLSSLLGG